MMYCNVTTSVNSLTSPHTSPATCSTCSSSPTTGQTSPAKSTDVHSLCFTDHSPVLCQLGVGREHPTLVTYHYRRIKQIDLDKFHRRVQQSQLYRETWAPTHSQSVDEYVKQFDDDITRILDDCMPLRSVTRRSGSHDCCLLSTEARKAKRACRRAERRYRRTITANSQAAAALVAAELSK